MAFWFCSPKYLDDEFNYIENSLLNLHHPKSFLQYQNVKPSKPTKENDLKPPSTHLLI